MLADKAQEAQGRAHRREPGADRLAAAGKGALRLAIPSNLDQDLPGRRVAHGFNIGLTPVLFAAMGYGLDRALGLVPVFTIAFTVLSVVGLMARFYYSYQATLAEEELAAAERRKKKAQP